ncbi:hypothetical protein [Haloferax denitrificans]|uniref:ASCH domain-containing protein n=1 Tax=Haloferax denitrificans ATCC 35960 TaxID=662478 RepID=M0JJA5_9EURY|nr:hypothetical protein [Haloferax denitrificans]EMA08433.1 hypothetical protein C438_01300 [Haloferax denitrificans ATCC 35960]
MNALLSIKPEFGEKILAGEKQYEFRRTTFSDANSIDFIYLYASSPVMQIIGGFTYNRIIEASPDELWELFGDQSGIEDQDRFMDYYEGAETGYAIEINTTYPLQKPITPTEIFEDFVPPVSFFYPGPEMDAVLRTYFPESVETEMTQLPQFSSD